MSDDITIPTRQQSPFDKIRQTRADGTEFWSGRSLMPLLGYDSWRRFADSVDRAKSAARNTGANEDELFAGAVKNPSEAGGRPAEDIVLTRYACYLVAMNGDPRKREVAAAQAYFAVRTREAETQPKFQIPQTMAAALRLAADEFDRAELAEAKVAELEPKADLADTLLTAEGGARLVRQVAKQIGMREGEFRRWLIDEKLIFARHAPCGNVQYDFYADHAHHFISRETLVQHTWGTCSHYTLYVLPQGTALIHARLAKQTTAAVGDR